MSIIVFCNRYWAHKSMEFMMGGKQYVVSKIPSPLMDSITYRLFIIDSKSWP